MAEIYLIYASEDLATIQMLDGLLSQQWETWWDDKLVGRFARVIETELPKAKIVVAVLSESSRDKDAFSSELRIAQKHGIEILFVRLDDATAPYTFDVYAYTELRDWSGEPEHSGFRQLQRRLATVAQPRKPPPRLFQTSDGRINLPTLFRSVSSYNTSIEPSEAVQALRVLEAPSILVSAYDLVNHSRSGGDEDAEEVQNMIRELKKYKKNGGFVLVDSGNYEATRMEDESWSLEHFREAITNAPHDFVFCLDEMNPSLGKNIAVKQIVDAVERDQEFTSAPILPIVHAPKLSRGGYKLDDIPYIVSEVSRIIQPPMIAIPERELGGGIIDRAKTVQAIRAELNKLPNYQPLHILGTGHPWAIAILTAAGADTFDGLEWCRYTFDDDEGISHFHLFDVFGTQDRSEMGFAGNVAFHNLNYLRSFENIMHDMVTQNQIRSWVQGILSKEAFSRLIAKYPELFE